MASQRIGPGKPVAKSRAPRKRLARENFLFFLMGVGLAILASFIPEHQPSSQTAALNLAPAANAPWGHLEYTHIRLERPDESLVDDGTPVPPAAWFFENYSELDLQKLFSAPDLTAEQSRQLLDKSHWTRWGNGWQILPPPATVISLSPAARARLYAVLRQSPQNPLQCHPFRVTAAEFEEWLMRTGLPPEKRDLIHKLDYHDGDYVCLSDFEVIESQCSVAERKCFAKAISENPTLVVRLRVTPDTDLDALERYWQSTGRIKPLRPFLQALRRLPGGAVIHVTTFFPKFASQRLYTYPDPDKDPTALKQDCFWTALNFQNEEPDPRFFNPAEVQKALVNDYVEVKSDRTFGDLLLLLDDHSQPVHICVYVADDIVFTKNGLDPLEPWVLMKIPDMFKRYPAEHPLQTLILRRKSS